MPDQRWTVCKSIYRNQRAALGGVGGKSTSLDLSYPSRWRRRLVTNHVSAPLIFLLLFVFKEIRKEKDMSKTALAYFSRYVRVK